MKHILHGLGRQLVAGLVLAISSLLLMSDVEVANAGGFFTYDYSVQSNKIVYSDPGSTAYFSYGTTTGASCNSIYNA